MTAILTEICSLLVGGITSIAQGIGTGLNSLVTDLFVVTNGDTTSLSVFGSVVAIFGGIALAIGLSKFVTKWIASLGARK